MYRYFEKNHILINNSAEDAWTVNEKEKDRIKKHVQNQGKRLKEWNIEINRGIITGLNEAFIIDEEIKSKLIQADPNSEQLISKF